MNCKIPENALKYYLNADFKLYSNFFAVFYLLLKLQSIAIINMFLIKNFIDNKISDAIISLTFTYKLTHSFCL